MRKSGPKKLAMRMRRIEAYITFNSQLLRRFTNKKVAYPDARINAYDFFRGPLSVM